MYTSFSNSDTCGPRMYRQYKPNSTRVMLNSILQLVQAINSHHTYTQINISFLIQKLQSILNVLLKENMQNPKFNHRFITHYKLVILLTASDVKTMKLFNSKDKQTC